MGTYRYGMRLRGFSPMCQPMDGLVEREDDTTGIYYDILIYSRKLSDSEQAEYELDELWSRDQIQTMVSSHGYSWYCAFSTILNGLMIIEGAELPAYAPVRLIHEAAEQTAELEEEDYDSI